MRLSCQTKCMKQLDVLFRSRDLLTFSTDTPSFFETEVLLLILKNSSLVPTICKKNPFHTVTPSFYHTYFKITLPFVPNIPKWPLVFCCTKLLP